MILLITGTTGIAAATAELAVARGHQVELVGLPDVDLTQPGNADAAVGHCVQRYGRVDALFHVAGASGRGHGDGPLDECSDKGWRFTLDANLTTAFYTARAVMRQMLRQQPADSGLRGSVLLMSSVLALSPESAHFASHAYVAAKGAILAMGRAMAAYYAPRAIRVNVIAPALVRTPMSERAQSSPEILRLMKSKQPLAGTLIEPEEVAKAALFLLSDESRHITGEVVAVDAGWRVS